MNSGVSLIIRTLTAGTSDIVPYTSPDKALTKFIDTRKGIPVMVVTIGIRLLRSSTPSE